MVVGVIGARVKVLAFVPAPIIEVCPSSSFNLFLVLLLVIERVSRQISKSIIAEGLDFSHGVGTARLAESGAYGRDVQRAHMELGLAVFKVFSFLL